MGYFCQNSQSDLRSVFLSVEGFVPSLRVFKSLTIKASRLSIPEFGPRELLRYSGTEVRH